MTAPLEPTGSLFVRMDALRHSERRAASARVASVIGHLIGTPLNVIAGRAALIRTNQSPEAVLENVRRIEEQVERLAQRIRQLIEYLAVVEPGTAPGSVSSVLEEIGALYGPVAEAKNVKLECAARSLDGACVDTQDALLVLTCLVSLATRTTEPGGVITLNATEQGTRTVRFEVLLPNLHIAPNRIDRLEPPDEGMGSDSDATQVLSICVSVARRNGGRLEALSVGDAAGVLVRFECARL